jgi:hypothetical protein
LLRRRSASQADEERSAEAAADAFDARRAAGKGRPTPKRREAQRRRTGPVAPPPRTRKEAYRRMREQNAVRRVEAREGIKSGEEKYLPSRDRGPARGLVRDVVDSRRNAGGLFLVVAFVVFVGYLVPSAEIRAVTMSLWLAVFVVLLVDSVVLSMRIRRLVRERHPEDADRSGKLIWYGVTRATMIRRWRMPTPRVKVGEKI